MGLLLGVWLAFKFGFLLGTLIGLSGITAKAVGFLIIVVVVLLFITIGSRAAKGLFKFTGLEMIDNVGGALLSLLKMALILSVLILCIEALSSKSTLANSESVQKSKLYTPIKNLSEHIFPYIDLVKNRLEKQI